MNVTIQLLDGTRLASCESTCVPRCNELLRIPYEGEVLLCCVDKVLYEFGGFGFRALLTVSVFDENMNRFRLERTV
jgi:hypothetical protein